MGEISVSMFVGKSFINKNAQNSGINNDIDMKRGSVAKLNIRNATMPKN